MSTVRIEVRGLDDLIRRLDADNFTPAFREFFEGAGQTVGREARALAPRLTGALAASIESQSDAMSALDMTDIGYAHFQEYGTRKMPAHPFMRPALDRSQGPIRGLLERLAHQIEARFGRG